MYKLAMYRIKTSIAFLSLWMANKDTFLYLYVLIYPNQVENYEQNK